MTTINAYGFASGLNNAGAIVALNPQPATPDRLGIEYEWYGNGLAEPYGFESTILVWSTASYEEKIAVLNQLGLSDFIASVYGTMCLRRNGRGDWFNANCSVSYIRGDKRKQGIGVNGLEIVVNQIEAL